MPLSRRDFLSVGLVSGAALCLPRIGLAASSPDASITASTRTLDVRGRAATVLSLANRTGGQGLVLDPGARFSVRVTNKLSEPTLIHWHGQVPPNEQDGVPDFPLPALRPGDARDYDYVPEPGTYWMHAHIPLQEMALLAAPLIVRSAEDLAADRQEVTLFLHDFSFTPPAELMASLGVGRGMNHATTGGTMGGMAGMTGMDHGNMSGMMAMDLNDIEFDAYLANDRTLDDPEVVTVDKGGRVLLRVINAAAATAFWIDLGAAKGSLVAVDGHAVEPVTGSRFPLSMGQRADIEVGMPADGAALPVLALREGAPQRTGIVLAPAGTRVARIAEEGALSPPLDLALEARLRPAEPLAGRAADKERTLMLGGTMAPYAWTIDGRTFADRRPVTAKSGERVELTLHNMSMMAHPMHLHGHVFQVVAINGTRFSGARRDTVLVPPMAAVTIALDAGEVAEWMFHCHHMPHLQTGMMTTLVVS
ncbi:multicopper oxidase family protein [Amaricoccus sp. W119]|jgi:FtsP/CotA-like multicopper oxidase with cupredoxin domain|uniref:multicopper oxidase family protein n=1 Tax=Amaricoccus sp. W119 TaxID=3391833 RepID=UPI0039A5D75E